MGNNIPKYLPISYTIIESDLLAYIEGGNRVISTLKDLKLVGIFKDLD